MLASDCRAPSAAFDGTGEVGAACEPIVRILGQRGSQNWVERGDFGSFAHDDGGWGSDCCET